MKNKRFNQAMLNPSVIGIYMQNGIFSETEENKGISYILDHLIFEKMAECIEDTGKGYVYAFTQYGYSGYNIICSPEMCEENMRNMVKVLTDNTWKSDSIGSWITERRKYLRKQPTPADTLYYAQRIPGSPLGQTLSGALNKIPTDDSLLTWHEHYYQKEAFCFCIDKEPTVLPLKPKLPQFEPISFDLPRHIPWRQSHMIIGFDCEFEVNELLAGEALCQWLTPYLHSIANRRNAQLLRVHICPMFVSELQIVLRAPRGKEQLVAEDVMNFLHSATVAMPEEELNILQKAVFHNYSPLVDDPLGWNRFRGESAIFYGAHLENTLDFLMFQKCITADKMECILSRIKLCSTPGLFATAAR